MFTYCFKSVKELKNIIIHKTSRGLQNSVSRESPATLYAVEDEVEKVFARKKSFFNKKASKTSILTVRTVAFFFSLFLL